MLRNLLTNTIDEIVHSPDAPERKDIDRLLFYFDKVKLLDKPKPKPTAMTPKIFRKLYRSSDIRWKAILLLSIQAGFTLKDIADVQKDDISFSNGNLIMEREKTGEIRFAKLDRRVLSAIREYMRECPNNTVYVFATTTYELIPLGSNFYDLLIYLIWGVFPMSNICTDSNLFWSDQRVFL